MSLPTCFIPHGGGPCFFMPWTMGPPDTWKRMEAWLRGLLATLPERPRAILLVSAHWEAPAFTLGATERPGLIFDYYGFPAETYQLTFPAPGAPDLADKVEALLSGAGLAVERDETRGWDHGVFIPLKLVTPGADIPVLQLSLKAGLDPAEHLAAGAALKPLRDQGVLIVGSGMSWHNMQGFSPAFTERSIVFDTWLSAQMTDPVRRDDAIRQWEQAPLARLGHPREEHLAPLFVAAGAASGEPGHHALRDQVMDVAVSAFAFG